jgi:hypothetical protein
MCLQSTYHPQDLLAMGFALAGLASARRGSWIGAGILVALAVLSQQFALLVAVALLVLAPSRRRVTFALAAIATMALAAVPILLLTSGGVIRDLFLGSGDSAGAGGTAVWELQLNGAPLLLVSRVTPIAFSLLLTAWIVRRLGQAAMEPVALISLIALSLSLRLAFEQDLYGYYFMALALTLILLEIARGHIRSAFVAWLAMVTVVYSIGPDSLHLFHLPWAGDAQVVLPLSVIALTLLYVVLRIVEGGSRVILLVGSALIAGTAVEWTGGGNPFSHPLPEWFWQVVLVSSGMALGASHEVVGIEAVIPGGDHSAGTSSPGVASSSSRFG